MNILILKFMFVIVALTARAGKYIFCEQVVRVNQEQFHFGYNKLDTLAGNRHDIGITHRPTHRSVLAGAPQCIVQRKALHEPTQSFASANAKLCKCRRKALHVPLWIFIENTRQCIRSSDIISYICTKRFIGWFL